MLDLAHNGGFAWGNNRLIEGPLAAPESERPEYVLFLNPDTLATPDCLRALIEFMDAHPGRRPGGEPADRPGRGTRQVQASAFRFQGFFSEIDDGLRLGPVSRLLARYKTKAPTPRHPTRRPSSASGSPARP